MTSILIRNKQLLCYMERSLMRMMIFFLSVLTMGCTNTQKNDKLVEALKDTTLLIRGSVVEIPTGDFRYDYYDIYEKDSHFKELLERGYQGGGPSWRGIVYGALKMSDPGILSKIRFDEEAEGLAIWCNDKETLNKIGRLIATVKADEAVLNECIHVAERGFEME